MRKKFGVIFICLFMNFVCLHAQNTITIEKVYSTYLRNSGAIIENKQVKGYFFLYQSDKIDKNTNEYTLQILDENLNKLKDIKFQDTRALTLLEAAYNGSSFAFLFKNGEDKRLDMKIYDLDGKLKFTYSKDYDRQTDDLMKRYETLHTDEGTNQNVYNLGTQGYVSVLSLRDGKLRTYEVDYFSSNEKKQWIYNPSDDEHYASAEFLGNTDSLIILEVMKKSRALSGKPTAHLAGINFKTRKQEFEIDDEDDEVTFVSSGVQPLNGTNNMLLFGSYYTKGANVNKDNSKGLAIYTIDKKGKILNKVYNSWGEDFSKYLPANSKGKIDNIGYLYIHKVLQMPDGKMFVVGEGYKRVANVGGIALTALAALGGVRENIVGNTKVITTDMVMMEFSDAYKIKAATIYDKTNNTVLASGMSDEYTQHTLGLYLKSMGDFDYQFTISDTDNVTFRVCYSDWVRDADYKGETFNSIKYNGTVFSTDKVQLKSNASKQKVFPGKAGSIMIMEYYKKEKRLSLRLEKLE